MKFYEVLRTLRKEKKLLIKDVAKVNSLSTDLYGKYERGERQPDIETLIKLANYYKVSLDYLTGRFEMIDDVSNRFTHEIKPKKENAL